METTFPRPAVASNLTNGPVSGQGKSTTDGSRCLAAAIERLVKTAPSVRALRKHRLHLAAARLWRSDARELPCELISDARAAAVHSMLAPFILDKARAAYDGPLMLMKGPEVAAHYPVPSDRPFHDLDLLVEDAEAAQRALVAAGFVEFGDQVAYAGLQHLPPLIWPDAPVVVEVHRRPSQPFWLAPVSAESIFRAAVPSALGVPGLVAPEPAAHAVLLVAHAWAHDPLGSAGHLLDVAAVLASADRARAGVFARAWGWEEMWNTTLAVIDAVIGTRRGSLALTLWARHLRDMRERLVLENHISRLAAPIWSLPAREVPQTVAYAMRCTAAPEHDEDWKTQLHRSCLALAHALRPASEHEQSLAWIAPRINPRRALSMTARRPAPRKVIPSPQMEKRGRG